jgi:hypothetical protein
VVELLLPAVRRQTGAPPVESKDSC